VGSDDPSEHASGRGLGIMRDEGIEVVLADGELAARARLLNQLFRKHAPTGRPWVLFKAAMTLDGKVATGGGDSKWISSEASRRHRRARDPRRRRDRGPRRERDRARALSPRPAWRERDQLDSARRRPAPLRRVPRRR